MADHLNNNAADDEHIDSPPSSSYKVVLVLSGKGGVGKTSVAAQLAFVLSQRGLNVGVLDIDICGPSIPRVLGVESATVHQSSAGWVPVPVGPDDDVSARPTECDDVRRPDESTNDVVVGNKRRLAAMSIGFLLKNRDDAVVWRGPKKNAMIRQFVSDVCWPSDMDYLVIDTPPGTSDEHISIIEALREVGGPLGLSAAGDGGNNRARGGGGGSVLVTTPQAVSVADVRRELTFCRKGSIPILGLVENMSGYTCPHCSECTNIFSTGGGEQLAQYAGIPFLGRLPIDPALTQAMEVGENFITKYPGSETVRNLGVIADGIVGQIAEAGKLPETTEIGGKGGEGCAQGEKMEL